MKKIILFIFFCFLISSNCTTKSETSVGGYYYPTKSDVQMGVNISWFNTWNENQALANVASAAREINNSPIPVDDYGHPTEDFSLYIYEGSDPGGTTGDGTGGGAQYGEHLCSFNWVATVTGNELEVDLWICLPPNATDEYLTSAHPEMVDFRARREEKNTDGASRRSKFVPHSIRLQRIVKNRHHQGTLVLPKVKNRHRITAVNLPAWPWQWSAGWRRQLMTRHKI